MTREQDETLVVIARDDGVELIDLGDAMEETKQVAPHGIWSDCQFGIGAKWGCG